MRVRKSDQSPMESRKNLLIFAALTKTRRRHTKSIQLVRLLPLTAVAIFFSSCGELPPGVQQPVAGALPTPIPSGWWNDEGGSDSPRIIVHLTEQEAYFYKGKKIGRGIDRFLRQAWLFDSNGVLPNSLQEQRTRLNDIRRLRG
jgi:hypothetical protein